MVRRFISWLKPERRSLRSLANGLPCRWGIAVRQSVRTMSGSLIIPLGALLPLLCGCGGVAAGPEANPSPLPPPMLALSGFVTGLSSPLGFEAPNDGTGRIFILEQAALFASSRTLL